MQSVCGSSQCANIGGHCVGPVRPHPLSVKAQRRATATRAAADSTKVPLSVSLSVSLTSSTPAPTAPHASMQKPDPFANPGVYEDTAADLLMISIFTKSLVDEMAAEGQRIEAPFICSYTDLVRVSKAVMKGRSPDAQSALVRRCLQNLTGGQGNITGMYKRFLPPSKWTAEINTAVAASCFKWLVGEAEALSSTIHLGTYESTQLRNSDHSHFPQQSNSTTTTNNNNNSRSMPVPGSQGKWSVLAGVAGSTAESPSTSKAAADISDYASGGPLGRQGPGAPLPGYGADREQRSVVKIKKCRYLEATGCVAICTNLCKTATQDFFLQDTGMPLTMKPNFDDLSCEMIFGQEPLPKAQDTAYAQPCFTHHCSALEAMAAREPHSQPCHQI